ncbi:hypothetical protein BLNAU_4469 [Blattamonas nauphoetae]|uniref:Uncharacterized protein n=1 Tax=Blattamonas nauphoetae TaxID=2049346 RepID=A0ABQ9YA06_9EUKA|nr:hypothetical protein BLNAU_4469 [Blattamonas nauphoetae]
MNHQHESSDSLGHLSPTPKIRKNSPNTNVIRRTHLSRLEPTVNSMLSTAMETLSRTSQNNGTSNTVTNKQTVRDKSVDKVLDIWEQDEAGNEKQFSNMLKEMRTLIDPASAQQQKTLNRIQTNPGNPMAVRPRIGVPPPNSRKQIGSRLESSHVPVKQSMDKQISALRTKVAGGKTDLAEDDVILAASRYSHNRRIQRRRERFIRQQLEQTSSTDPKDGTQQLERSKSVPPTTETPQSQRSRSPITTSPERDTVFLTGVNVDEDLNAITPHRSESPINSHSPSYIPSKTNNRRRQANSVNGGFLTREEKRQLYSSPSRMSSHNPSVSEDRRLITPLIQTSLEMIHRNKLVVDDVRQRQAEIERQQRIKQRMVHKKHEDLLSNPDLTPQSHGAYNSTSALRQNQIRWQILITSFSRIAILQDVLSEDRARRDLRDAQQHVEDEKLVIKKRNRMKERQSHLAKSWMTLSRAIGRYITTFRAKKRTQNIDMILGFLEELKQQNHLVQTIKNYRSQVMRAQTIARNYALCRIARRSAAMAMWKEEEGILLKNQKRRPVDEKHYPRYRDSGTSALISSLLGGPTAQASESARSNKNVLPNGVTLLPVLFATPKPQKKEPTAEFLGVIPPTSTEVTPSPATPQHSLNSYLSVGPSGPASGNLKPLGGPRLSMRGLGRKASLRNPTRSPGRKEMFSEELKLDIIKKQMNKYRTDWIIENLYPRKRPAYLPQEETTNKNLIVRYTDWGATFQPQFQFFRLLRSDLPLLIIQAYEKITETPMQLPTKLMTKAQKERVEKVLNLKPGSMEEGE